MRKPFIVLAILNILMALLVAVGGPTLVQGVHTIIMSKYHTLDTRVVIDHSKLEAVWGEDAAKDWGVAVEHLVGDPLRGLARCYCCISALFCINAIVLLRLQARLRQNATLPAAS